MTEPDVALTDYGLAIECALLTFLLYRRGDRRSPFLTRFLLFFGSLALAALAGGTVHGFFLDPTSAGNIALWRMTLIAIGVTALSAWLIGADLLLSNGAARRLTIFALIEFVGYCGVILFGAQAFGGAILNYLPATLFLLFGFSARSLRTGESSLEIGVMGLLLTFAAAGIQRWQITLHPTYLNYNALYHLIQAVANFMIYWPARILVGATRARG